ncbi:Hsp20/alpha crystallin family protein [Bernardetia sp. ABR2-2B]|uniref:Hsp20/alpha crystallin family protein n=1 Tax=Bernardetia sp. ABR2-2B TaxID=3127472 RepID=UPI0030CC5C25
MMTIDKTLTKKLALQSQAENIASGGTVPTKMFLSEEENGYLLRLTAASVKPNSYKIEVRQGHLIIMSLVKISEFEGVPRFMQAFPILPHVDSNGIEARYINGELQVFAPFTEDNQTGDNRKINIDF